MIAAALQWLRTEAFRLVALEAPVEHGSRTGESDRTAPSEFDDALLGFLPYRFLAASDE